VIGLDRGADLCMTKPISLAELRARLRALLRRAERNKSPRAQALTIGDLRIDPRVRRAWLYEQELQLTPKDQRQDLKDQLDQARAHGGCHHAAA